MTRSADIKNLCIALEALNRIPNSMSLSGQVEALLLTALAEEEKRKPKPYTPYHPEYDSDPEIPF